MIKILIVDDSSTETLLLKKIFEAEKDMCVIACAKNGAEAIALNKKLNPDLITMDINMPVMDGVEATQIIISQNPKPIIIISSAINTTAANITFQALEAGALSVLPKPQNISSPDFASKCKEITDTIRNLADIKVIKRRFNIQSKKRPSPPEVNHKHGEYEIIAIGTSVGGPQVLKTLLTDLPEDFPVPIVIVQHMAEGFMDGFTHWLHHNTHLKVKNAEDSEPLKKGTVYFAPDHYHFTVARHQSGLMAKLIKGDPVSGFCPSITVLFQSVAKACGKNAIGVLLTGMGQDGALGLLEIKKAAGHTLIQDEKSSVVFGMGGVAQSLGAVDKVLDISQLADYIIKIT